MAIFVKLLSYLEGKCIPQFRRICYNTTGIEPDREEGRMRILYADDRVVVCVKPAGVLSTDEPGGMPERLRAVLGGDAVVRSVHRLDRVVGGLMVYALTRRAAADLSKQIEDGVFLKEYLAVVRGVTDAPAGTYIDHIHRDRQARKTVIVPEGTARSQLAVLDYRLLGVRDELSLLGVTLHTGRTHQIRCQLSGHGYPIAGDVKYGGAPLQAGIALWSARLGFLHPRTGESMRFYLRPPEIAPWDRFTEYD